MKAIRQVLSVVYSILLPCFMCSCTSNSVDKRVVILDILAETDPQLALSEINDQWKTLNQMSRHNRMCVELIKYKAEDKNYIVHTSDSTIRILADYFQSNGSVYDKLQSLYLMGSTYRDMDNFPEAIVCYDKAIELAETNDLTRKDSIVLTHIYSQKAEILYRIGNGEEAFRQLEFSMKIENDLGKNDFVTMEDMGRCAAAAGKSKTAARYYKSALTNIIEQEQTSKYVDYLGEQLGFYIKSKMEIDAEYILGLIRTCRQSHMPGNVYAAIASYYEWKNQPDSALKYDVIALRHKKGFASKAELSERICKILYKKDNLHEACKYAMMSLAYADSANLISKAKEVNRANAQRIFAELKEARTFKKETMQQRKLYLAMAVVFVLLIITALLLVHHFNNKRKLKLNGVIQEMTDEKKKLAADYKRLKDCVLADRQLRAESSKDVSDVIKYLQDLSISPKERLQPDAWDMLFNAGDKLHPEFRNRLISYNGDLNNEDLILLYLLKLGFRQADISRILKRNASVISRRLNRIEHMLGVPIKEALRD